MASSNAGEGLGHRLWWVTKEAGNEWLEDKAPKMSAALAYYTTISIAPLIIVTMKIVGVVIRDSDRAQRLLSQQMSSLGGQQLAALAEGINKAKQPGAGVLATVLSIVIALFGASGVFGELQDSLNTIWEVRPKPNRGIWGVVQDRFLSMTMVLGIAFLLLVSMFVSTVIGGVSTQTIHKVLGGDGELEQWLLMAVNVVLSIAVITLLFAAIFRFLPDVKIGWGDVWVGAFFTSVMFEVGKFGLWLYFKFGSPTSEYGAAGSIVAALLWICYSAYILYFGAEFTQVYANRYGSHIVPASNAEPLTEEMRRQQGIPHSDAPPPAAQGAKSPASAPASQKPRYTPQRRRAPARTSIKASARRVNKLAKRPRRPPMRYPIAAGNQPPHYHPEVVRLVPIFAGLVLGRFAFLRYRRWRENQALRASAQQVPPLLASRWGRALVDWGAAALSTLRPMQRWAARAEHRSGAAAPTAAAKAFARAMVNAED